MSATLLPETVYAVPQDVAWVWLGEEARSGVVVAVLPDGPPHVLDDSAALIWWAASGRTAAEVRMDVASSTGRPAQEVAELVSEFLEALVAHRLLMPWAPST